MPIDEKKTENKNKVGPKKREPGESGKSGLGRSVGFSFEPFLCSQHNMPKVIRENRNVIAIVRVKYQVVLVAGMLFLVIVWKLDWCRE